MDSPTTRRARRPSLGEAMVGLDLDGTGNGKKNLLVIYTGGTLGMQADEGGSLAPVEGYLLGQMKLMPELNTDRMPNWDLLAYSPLIDSSDMDPSDWKKIATDIEENYFHYDGFVVIMGTDTMAFAASALSFMLENLGKSIVVTGSMIPLSEVYTDARRNLIVSMLFAVSDDYPEVCIFFNDKLLRGNRASKVNSTGLDAFDSPNYPPLAKLGVNIDHNERAVLAHPRGPFSVYTETNRNVLVVKLAPGFTDTALDACLTHGGLQALVLESYGTGNAASNTKGGFLKILEKAIRQQFITIVISTQCHKGCVLLRSYKVGEALSEIGVVSGLDMTTEAIVTKLGYLLARFQDRSKRGRQRIVSQLMGCSLRGELSPEGDYKRSIFRPSTSLMQFYSPHAAEEHIQRERNEEEEGKEEFDRLAKALASPASLTKQEQAQARAQAQAQGQDGSTLSQGSVRTSEGGSGTSKSQHKSIPPVDLQLSKTTSTMHRGPRNSPEPLSPLLTGGSSSSSSSSRNAGIAPNSSVQRLFQAASAPSRGDQVKDPVSQADGTYA
jgi:L-asparaginase